MSQDVSLHVQLTPDLPRNRSIQQEESSLHQQIGVKFKEETSNEHLEHNFVWCRKLDTSENRSELNGMF
jgi:hypothetical protein